MIPNTPGIPNIAIVNTENRLIGTLKPPYPTPKWIMNNNKNANANRNQKTDIPSNTFPNLTCLPTI